jgi:two-component system NtrC family sensor kinase
VLRTKLFLGFALLVITSGVLSILIGVRTIDHRITEEAQSRVRLDLRSAWAEVNNELDDIESVLRAVADSQSLAGLCERGEWDDPAQRLRFERARVREGLDFLELVSPEGVVVMRSAPPDVVGDSRLADATVAGAMRGEAGAAMTVLSSTELERMGVGLAEQAFLELDDTPGSRRLQKAEETRAMAMVGAVPVTRGSRVLGIVHGGVLVNRNHALVDRIHDVVFQNETYQGRPLGTATLFLGDSRVATTVRHENGTRALGSRASREVADRVLDNGLPWVDKAMVVGEWRLTAYEPIRDGLGKVIGMLYVGILKAPYEDAARSVAWNFVLISVFVLLVALVLAFTIAGRLARPIHRLVEASNRMRHGDNPGPVPTGSACKETEELIVAFNEMSATLTEREQSLRVLNRSYMETLGFVSHELRSPVSSIMNYGFLLRQNSLGALNEKQHQAVERIEAGGKRLVEMIRHYLNLSRIENGELEPAPAEVRVVRDVLEPLVTSLESELEERGMALAQEIDPGVVLRADTNQVREVFENLVGNAIKYGRAGGAIRLEATPLDGSFEFTVWNEGEGFSPDEAGDLFQKFSRLKRGGRADHEKGTGLGLFITKHIVEGHGGRIEAASAPGEWASFTFTLPRWDPGPGPAASRDRAGGARSGAREPSGSGVVA